MLRKYIFKNNVTGQEIVLPVTPSSFQIDRGVPVQTVDLHDFGELALPGSGLKLFQEDLEFMLPRQHYPFCQPETNTDPYFYIDFFQLAGDRKQPLRFVISDTPTICDVLVENLQYGERDGTNDVYCTLTMHRYRAPGAAGKAGATASGVTTSVSAGNARTSDTPPAAQQTYTIKPHDSLWTICRRFYGDGELAAKLAAYNGIKNPALIYAGNALRIPAKAQL